MVGNAKNPAVEGRGSLSSSFRSSGLAQGKGTENLPSHIRPPASCARGEMHPAFLGIMAGRIFLWVQAQDIRRKDDDNLWQSRKNLQKNTKAFRVGLIFSMQNQFVDFIFLHRYGIILFRKTGGR